MSLCVAPVTQTRFHWPADYFVGDADGVIFVEEGLEIGIDVGTTQPRLLTDDLARQADLLVTMGCGESCPVVPGLRRKDWPLDDPKDKPLEQVRQIRDEIARRVSALVAELGLSQ